MTEVISTIQVNRLRQRLIEDMNLRHFSMELQHNYTRDIGRFKTYLGRRPDTPLPRTCIRSRLSRASPVF